MPRVCGMKIPSPVAEQSDLGLGFLCCSELMHYLHVLLLLISQLGSRGERSGLRRLEPNRLLLMLSEQAGY